MGSLSRRVKKYGNYLEINLMECRKCGHLQQVTAEVPECGVCGSRKLENWKLVVRKVVHKYTALWK